MNGNKLAIVTTIVIIFITTNNDITCMYTKLYGYINNGVMAATPDDVSVIIHFVSRNAKDVV